MSKGWRRFVRGVAALGFVVGLGWAPEALAQRLSGIDVSHWQGTAGPFDSTWHVFWGVI
jgi:hypothetical protein